MENKWEEKTLGNCADWHSGGTPSKSNGAYWSGSIPWVSAKDMKSFRLHDTEDHISLHAVGKGGKVVPAKTILLLVRGMTLHNDVPICMTMREMAFNQDIKALQPVSGVDGTFLAYWLLAHKPDLLASVDHAGHGTGRLVTETLKGKPVRLPPLSEQRAIASVLGMLDDKIENNRILNHHLEQAARALFKSWFVDFDPVHAKLDGRQPFGLDPTAAALFPANFQDSPLGPIPKGWEVVTIEEATSLIIDYRGRTPKKMGSDWSESGIPAVSAKNVKGGRLVRPEMFNFVSEELFERWMQDKLAIGDILMTSEAPLGELYYLALDARFCLSQRVFALRANPTRCEATFLYYWLDSASCQTEILNRGTGTTVEGIRQSELRKVAALLPPLSIQKAAAKFLSDWTEQIHRNEEQSRTLAALRDTLLPRLMSGELSVADVAAK